MRGWSSIFVGFLLLAAAYWSFASDGFGSSTLMCGTPRTRRAQRTIALLSGASVFLAERAADPPS